MLRGVSRFILLGMVSPSLRNGIIPCVQDLPCAISYRTDTTVKRWMNLSRLRFSRTALYISNPLAVIQNPADQLARYSILISVFPVIPLSMRCETLLDPSSIHARSLSFSLSRLANGA